MTLPPTVARGRVGGAWRVAPPAQGDRGRTGTVRIPGPHPTTFVCCAATIPANGPYILCDDDVGAICGRFDINLTLLSMPKRLNRSAGRAENRPQASSEHTSPVATGNRRVVRLASQTDE